jgi:hypothetical protein
MNSVTEIEARRKELLAEMDAIRSLERATLTEQMLAVKHKENPVPVMRGPYYLLARWENGKTRSRRVSGEELERVRQDVTNHQRFRALCKEFEELTERLGQLERQAGASEEALKRGLKSRSSRARKSGK